MASGGAAEVKKVRTANCTVKDKESELYFSLNAELAAADITFTIIAGKEEGTQVGVLEIVNADKKLLRRNESKPFPAGSIVKNKSELKEVDKLPFFKVKLEKKTKGIDLNKFFFFENAR